MNNVCADYWFNSKYTTTNDRRFISNMAKLFKNILIPIDVFFRDNIDYNFNYPKNDITYAYTKVDFNNTPLNHHHICKVLTLTFKNRRNISNAIKTYYDKVNNKFVIFVMGYKFIWYYKLLDDEIILSNTRTTQAINPYNNFKEIYLESKEFKKI